MSLRQYTPTPAEGSASGPVALLCTAHLLATLFLRVAVVDQRQDEADDAGSRQRDDSNDRVLGGGIDSRQLEDGQEYQGQPVVAQDCQAQPEADDDTGPASQQHQYRHEH